MQALEHAALWSDKYCENSHFYCLKLLEERLQCSPNLIHRACWLMQALEHAALWSDKYCENSHFYCIATGRKVTMLS